MELPNFLHYTFLSPLVISTHFSSYSSYSSSSTSYFFRPLQINFTFPNYLFNLPHSHCRSQPPILSFSAQVYQLPAPILRLTPPTPITPRQTQPSPPKMLLSHPLYHKPTVPQQDASPHSTLTTTIDSSTFTHISAHPPTSPPPPPHSSLPPPNIPTRFLFEEETHLLSSIINTIKTIEHTSGIATRKHTLPKLSQDILSTSYTITITTYHATSTITIDTKVDTSSPIISTVPHRLLGTHRLLPHLKTKSYPSSIFTSFFSSTTHHNPTTIISNPPSTSYHSNHMLTTTNSTTLHIDITSHGFRGITTHHFHSNQFLSCLIPHTNTFNLPLLHPQPPLYSQLSKSSYFIPSPPPSSPSHPPTPPPPLPLPHSLTDADADGADTAMAHSSLLTTTSNLNYTTFTLKTIEPTNNSTTTISSTASNFTSNSNSIAA
nr:hypothetical transcript [Hymenolepis microstoma]